MSRLLLALVSSCSSRLGGREVFFEVAAALLLKMEPMGLAKPEGEAHGAAAALRLVSLEGLGLDAVRDKQAAAGCRGLHSDRRRPMLQAS